MNKDLKKMNLRQRTTVVFSVLVMLVLAAAPGASVFSQTAAPTQPPTPTVVPTQMIGGANCAAGAASLTWYVGLGSGGNPDEITKETAWLDNFNKSQTDACV